MNFKDYQDEAAQYAVYPKDRELEYLALGLVGELGEFRLASDMWNDAHSDYAADPRTRVLDELGDVWWYLSMLARHFGIDGIDDIDEEQVLSHVTNYALLICGCAKRIIREGVLSYNDGVRIQSYLRSLMSQLLSYTSDFDNASNVWRRNLGKLADRQQRNVINGEGDHR